MANVGDMVFDGVKYGVVVNERDNGTGRYQYDILFTDPETNTSEVTCFYADNYVDTWRRNFVMGYHQRNIQDAQEEKQV